MVNVGDTVSRFINDKGKWIVMMELQVTAIEDGVIHCGEWTFDAEHGLEIDDYLGWGPQYGITGTVIRPKGETP